jgi:hypothetical protein
MMDLMRAVIISVHASLNNRKTGELKIRSNISTLLHLLLHFALLGSESKTDQLKPLLNHDVNPINIQGVSNVHEPLRLPLVDDLQYVPSRCGVAPNAFLLQGRYQVQYRHLIRAGRACNAGHEQREDDESQFQATGVYDVLRNVQNSLDTMRDIVV